MAVFAVAFTCIGYFVRGKGSFMDNAMMYAATLGIAASAVYAVCKKEAGDE